MRRVMLPLMLAAATTVASAAAAQQNYGRPVDSPENRAVMGLRFSSRCAVNKTPATARKLIDTGVASPEEAKIAKSLVAVARECYPTQWPAFPPTLVRGAVAEAFYLDAYRASAPAVTTPAAPPASFGVVPAGTTGTPEQEIAWTLAAVANCTVFADGAGVRHLILGPASVDEETKRFAALAPAIGKCLPAAQASVLKPMTFRGYLADALYRQARSKAQ